MKFFVKTILCICITSELFNTVSNAVQTSYVGKSNGKNPVLLQRTCGQATHQNCTHFTSPGYPDDYSEATECTLTLLRSMKQNICQIRLDFLDFQTGNPTDGNCLDDKFTVRGNNINTPVPELCGNNAGQHMYIDVENNLSPVYLTMSTKGLGRRNWNIKTSYIECSNPSKAPKNCLQYYRGPQGTFSSFNYARDASNGGYLNNLNYPICFRKELGRCSQTYTAQDIESFLILNLNRNTSPTVGGGEAGLGVLECPNDYLRLEGDRYCGARLNPDPSATNPTTNVPVTDTSAGPFIAYFKSDSENNANGFRLYYNQNPC
ncbi:hypothetical protein JTE90_028816 [Oedothorax gibbosus]|uniref:CUB domain-containing protein n=1 Tax=Oedothorax gibbosus TaxID=931172 RepID=A0AAV6VYN4_9ARAC|nr:hypothetical protein JTE90_028816 [Oedothorax gibbosus]